MPAIKKPNEHFDALTYAGSASNQTISGLNFQPDFIWFKERTTNGIDHNLFDSARSNYGSRLISNATNAEAASGAIIGVSSTGYSLLGGVSTTNDAFGRTYVTWNWKAGGAAVANTSGSISSQVSVNSTAGFSIVTYTGTGANATVGHGLGVAPSMYIVKRRSNTGNWYVYHISIGNTNRLRLDETSVSTAESAAWNDTSPTSTVFSIGTSVDVNASTNTYVAYCFAPIAGYSAFGSYTGNGSDDGPFIYTGFRPKFIFRKCSSTAGENSMQYDTSMNPYNASPEWLSPNTSDASNIAGGYYIDFLSNGVKIRHSATGNNSGRTYIYMAFAESPFKFANAR